MFKEPQGEPFGQTVKFLNCLLPWCLNKLLPRLPGQSQEGGRPLFLMARHDALLPSPGGLRPGLPLDLAVNHLGGHLWAAASGSVGRPWPVAVSPQPVWLWTRAPLPGTACSDLRVGGLGCGSLSLSWFLRFSQLSRQSSNKNLKGSVAQGVCETLPPLESISTHRFVPAFNHCLSHRDVILRDADNGVPRRGCVFEALCRPGYRGAGAGHT